ncbi:hypothetical protein PybrP1_002250 [[Pythium] brassicae (nom. inval.)]|nr:hypothetical protein PybrP1_002250 [[Pythium] brassicae (nom. inval.)]
MKPFSSVRVTLLAIAAALLQHSEAARQLTATVDVLAYNDVYEVQPVTVNGVLVGGPSRVAPLVRDMRAKNPNSLVLFAGDTMSPSLWSSQFLGLQMVDVHNALGADFASLGNHEFDFGVDAFLNVSAASNFPWLNANCFEIASGSLLRGTVPRAVKTFKDPTFGTIKIGFFGVMYDMKDASKGLYWSDPIEAGKQQVAALKALNVDFIIALTHQDLVDDNRFSKEVAGVNIIYAGHDHSSMLQTNFGAPYLKADFDFRSIWTSRLEYFAPSGSLTAYTRMTHRAVPIVEEMPTDPKVEAIIADYAAKIGPLYARVVGTLCAPLDLSNRLVRGGDAPVGYVFTEAALNFYGVGSADLAVMNGGGIRTDKVYPTGPISVGELIGWSPFGNMFVLFETDGASLKSFIRREMVTSCGDNLQQPLNGLYVHPGGFKYTFKCTGAGAGNVSSIEWFKHPTRSGPLLDTDVFKLAMNNFVYRTEFLVSPGAVTRRMIVNEAEAARIDRALEVYIKSLPDTSVCVAAEGRSSVSF